MDGNGDSKNHSHAPLVYRKTHCQDRVGGTLGWCWTLDEDGLGITHNFTRRGRGSWWKWGRAGAGYRRLMTQRRVDVGSPLVFERIQQDLEDVGHVWVQKTLPKSEKQRNHAIPCHSLLAYKHTSKKANTRRLWRFMEEGFG